MMRGFVFFQIVLVGLSSAQQPCIPPSGKPSCVCDTADGTIDLSSISNTDGTARFTNIPQTNGDPQFTYSYNPCISYYEGYSSCSYGSTAACQYTENDNYYMLGDASTETMYIDSDTGNNYLQYDNGDDGRVTKVYLMCDQNVDSPSITADGDGDTPLTYIYHLTTKCACPGGCSDSSIPTVPPTKPGGGGGGGRENSGKSGVAPGEIGIVLVIVMVTGFVTYFVVGAVVLNRKFEKEGKEMIPQKDLWFSLPFLVKDGCVFTFGPLVNLIRHKTGKGGGDYENIK
ncbi:PREDICTED: uncharacterized protein LOC105312529 [Amphimedon queenslandica]|uniref:Cation-dependent mannose-6-phosphate receptor n=1 Tax=Amphimedon queenslandica TaxID=400682 RepID=A0AAN0J3I2_AMPQE|nr:PREDICTED: uncharacterized protein LOC105312529 [Amphimedon queenslandica]|eukprot:XP_019851288.1 PREDICTED: uncharacterized protein LOC105312529 [Amphimedon queenslandica]